MSGIVTRGMSSYYGTGRTAPYRSANHEQGCQLATARGWIPEEYDRLINEVAKGNSMKEYPLSWPQGWKITPATERRGARFVTIKRGDGEGAHQRRSTGRVSVAEATKRVLKELAAFDVSEQDAIISTNLLLRNDGLPRSSQPEPANPGAAVYWRVDRVAPYKVLAIDQYTRVADNLAAIAATLNAMRLIDRRGNAEILTRVFQGFAALEGPAKKTWREVLGFSAESVLNFGAVRSRFLELAKAAHPDNGGSVAAMQELNEAYEAARKAHGI